MNIKKLSLLIATVGLLTAGLFIFFELGNWLVVNDELKQADAIVVLMGSPGDRILEAKDVYSGSFSNLILFVEDDDPGRKVLKSRGIVLQDNADKSRILAIQLGIPDSIILILPGDALSTIDEAKIIRGFIDNNNDIKSIILISSSSHMRRASMIFNHELSKCKNSIEIIYTPSKYSNFDGVNWWKERESRKKVVLEYLKLIQFLLFD